MSFASFAKRFLAFFIDCMVLSVATSVLGNFVPWSIFTNISHMIIASMVLGCIIFLFYSALFESSKYQATPGKMLMGLKVTDAQGVRINTGKAFMRAFIKSFFAVFPLNITFIACAFTGNKQNLHDFAADTFVVNVKSESSPASEKGAKIAATVIIVLGLIFTAGSIALYKFVLVKVGFTVSSIKTLAQAQQGADFSKIIWPERRFDDIGVSAELPFMPKRDTAAENSAKTDTSNNIADIIIYANKYIPFEYQIQYITYDVPVSAESVMQRFTNDLTRYEPEEKAKAFEIRNIEISGMSALKAIRTYTDKNLSDSPRMKQLETETGKEEIAGNFDEIIVIPDGSNTAWVIHSSTFMQSFYPLIQKAMDSVKITKGE